MPAAGGEEAADDEKMPVAGGEEGATDNEKKSLIAQLLNRIREADPAREAADGAAVRIHLPGESGDQAKQLRITLEGVLNWAEIGERCKRI